MFGLQRETRETSKVDNRGEIEEQYRLETSVTRFHLLLIPIISLALGIAGLCIGILAVVLLDLARATFEVVLVGATLGLLCGIIISSYRVLSLVQISYSESYRERERLQAQSKKQVHVQVQPVEISIWQETGNGATRQVVEFQNYALLTQVAQHLLSGGDFNKRAMSYLVNKNEYTDIRGELIGAGLAREVDGRGTTQITSSGRAVMRKLIG